MAGERVVVASQALMDEVCDEDRFSKVIAASLNQVRNGTHDGLFTATGPQEQNWGIAHRVLMPALGPLAIRNMFDEMHDIASYVILGYKVHRGSGIAPRVTNASRTETLLDELC